MTERPAFHAWDDAGRRGKHALWILPVGLVIVGWFKNPEFSTAHAIGAALIGAVVAASSFGIAHLLREEVLTGRMSGERLFGHGPDSDEVVPVTHLYDVAAHPYRCGCGLFHSIAEAERAGFMHNGDVFVLDGFGWAGFPFVRVKVPGEDRYLPMGRD